MSPAFAKSLSAKGHKRTDAPQQCASIFGSHETNSFYLSGTVRTHFRLGAYTFFVVALSGCP
jgi:hypothetical protein